MSELHGVVPAPVTPMTPDGRLNEEAYRRMLEYNIQAGVHGFWLAGGSGESVLLDDEENRRIAEIAVDQGQGRVTNIMHVGAATTERAAALAEHAAKVGVDAICCVPPFFYRRTDDHIAEHYRVVAGAADLPLLVYNLPASTGVDIGPELMARIQDRVPQLAGLKHSSQVFYLIGTFAEMGLACFIGSSVAMLPGLTIGAVGCVDGPPTAAPEIWLEIWDAYQAGDLRRAEAAQRRARQIWTVLRDNVDDYHAVMKFMVGERLGIDCGPPRPPALPLSPEVQARVRERMAELGLEKVSL